MRTTAPRSRPPKPVHGLAVAGRAVDREVDRRGSGSGGGTAHPGPAACSSRTRPNPPPAPPRRPVGPGGTPRRTAPTRAAPDRSTRRGPATPVPGPPNTLCGDQTPPPTAERPVAGPAPCGGPNERNDLLCEPEFQCGGQANGGNLTDAL